MSAEGLKCCQGARWKRERSIDITPSLFSCWCLHSSVSVFQRVVDQSESETCKQRTDRSSVLTVPSEVSLAHLPQKIMKRDSDHSEIVLQLKTASFSPRREEKQPWHQEHKRRCSTRATGQDLTAKSTRHKRRQVVNGLQPMGVEFTADVVSSLSCCRNLVV